MAYRSSTTGGRYRRTADLTTSEGLSRLAERTGGAVAEKAKQITGEKTSLFSKVGGVLKKGLSKTLDILQRPNYAIAGSVRSVIDKDPTTNPFTGAVRGFFGKEKNTFSDVLGDVGVNPTSKLGKLGKGAAGLALDILLDPTTYVTFGESGLVKIGLKGGEAALSKAGTELLAKGVAQKAGQAFGEDFVKRAIARMAESSPAMYKKFIDQGGIKFFGETIVSGGRLAALAKSVPGMTKIDEATAPIRNTLYSLFNRDASATYGKLPKEFTDIKQKYLDLGAVRSSEAINKVIDIAKANKLTAHEATMITDAIEAKLPLADARLENARKLFLQVMGRDYKKEAVLGIQEGYLPNYVPHILVDEPVRNLPFKPEGVRVSLGAAKERTIEGTVKEINERFGKEFFDPNVVNTVAIRSIGSARAVSAAEFLRETAQKFGVVAEKAPTGYVDVAVKELQGLKFHPAIAEQVNNFKKGFIGDQATNNLLRAFDKAQSLWKASVTSIFPAFHGRNAISNVFLNFLDIGKDAISPAKHFLSTTLLNDNRTFQKLERAALGVGEDATKAKTALKELADKVVLTDDFGKKWTFGDLRQVIKDNRVAFGDEFTGFLDVRGDIAGKLEGATKGTKLAQAARAVNPLSQQNVAFRTGRGLGNLVEQQARVLNFITNLEKTGDVATAAKRTKQFLFDYTNLSDFEKNVMRRLVPFYTFTRKNLELQAEQLLKQPGKFAGQAKLVTSLSKMISGGTLSEKERANLPQFLQEGLGIVISRDKNNVQVINSLGLPIEQVFSNLKPNVLLGSLSPILAVPLQVAIGKHFFFDRDLATVNDAKAYQNAPQFLKDYIGYTTRKNKDGSTRHIALNPTRLFILNNIPPSSRVVSTIGQLEEENVSGKLKLLRQLTGLKPYGADLDRQAAINEKEKVRELQDLLDVTGVAPVFRRSFIPK